MTSIIISFFGALILWMTAVYAACECGYLVPSANSTRPMLLTHRMYSNFSAFPDRKVPDFQLKDWEVQTWKVAQNKSLHAVARKNDAENIWVSNGRLVLRQKGYQVPLPGEDEDRPVSVAEMHSRRKDILYGSFRVRSEVHIPEQMEGGAVAGFFFYNSDVVEADIEVISKNGTKTVVYTNHPAYDRDHGGMIQNVSYTQNLTQSWVEHKFDWTPEIVRYFQDNRLQRAISKNVPHLPGKIMMNLWANNGSWSGQPSTKDVTMEVHYINLYFNTTASNNGTDEDFNRRCAAVRDKAPCRVNDGDNDVNEEMIDAQSGYMELATPDEKELVNNGQRLTVSTWRTLVAVSALSCYLILSNSI